jgi:hypothetical protein
VVYSLSTVSNMYHSGIVYLVSLSQWYSLSEIGSSKKKIEINYT